MKKGNLIALFILSFACTNVFAQSSLKKTVWKGVINIPDPLPVELHFKQDTFTIKNANTMEVVEIMGYKQIKDTLIIAKLNGSSDCDNEPAKYLLNWKKKDEQFSFIIVQDNCSQRSQPLSNALVFEKVITTPPVTTPPKKKK